MTRAAVSIKPNGADEPIFGAIWLAARVSTDRENRTVTLRQLAVTDAKFPYATPEQIDQLSGMVEDEFGELHWFAGDRAADHGAESAPFVPRSLITGRALLVFWPIRPSLGIRGPRWIH